MNKRLEYLRKEYLKLSMEAFGKRIGLTRSAINQMEKGTSNITEQTILLISREFKINENWLRSGEGEMLDIEDEDNENVEYGEACLDIAKNDELAKKAILMYSHLTPEDKELFWKFVKKFGNFDL